MKSPKVALLDFCATQLLPKVDSSSRRGGASPKATWRRHRELSAMWQFDRGVDILLVLRGTVHLQCLHLTIFVLKLVLPPLMSSSKWNQGAPLWLGIAQQ